MNTSNMKALYSLTMPVRSKDDDDQGFEDRVRQYDNFNNQNFLLIQQVLYEQQQQIEKLKGLLGG